MVLSVMRPSLQETLVDLLPHNICAGLHAFSRFFFFFNRAGQGRVRSDARMKFKQ